MRYKHVYLQLSLLLLLFWPNPCHLQTCLIPMTRGNYYGQVNGKNRVDLSIQISGLFVILINSHGQTRSARNAHFGCLGARVTWRRPPMVSCWPEVVSRADFSRQPPILPAYFPVQAIERQISSLLIRPDLIRLSLPVFLSESLLSLAIGLVMLLHVLRYVPHCQFLFTLSSARMNFQILCDETRKRPPFFSSKPANQVIMKDFRPILLSVSWKEDCFSFRSSYQRKSLSARPRARLVEQVTFTLSVAGLLAWCVACMHNTHSRTGYSRRRPVAFLSFLLYFLDTYS